MKLAITGHTKGIGKAIADLYPDHIGFSRSNGHDIGVTSHREIIISESSDCDVFVNNAYQNDYQNLMFSDIFLQWEQDSTKTIVNIISRAKYITGTDVDYYNHKNALATESDQQMFGRKCRVININPGFVMTESSKPDIEKYNMPYITADKCAGYVKWALEQDLEIGELSFWKSK
jgi:NAD(P)-dependent dehydrogenase (short-subunit alcohol dehydrogenase family)